MAIAVAYGSVFFIVPVWERSCRCRQQFLDFGRGEIGHGLAGKMGQQHRYHLAIAKQLLGSHLGPQPSQIVIKFGQFWLRHDLD